MNDEAGGCRAARRIGESTNDATKETVGQLVGERGRHNQKNNDRLDGC